MTFRLLLLLLISGILPSLAYADVAQERRLTISTSIFPKIVALDQKLFEKVDSNGSINLAIIYKLNKGKADKVAGIISKKVNQLAGFPTRIEVLTLDTLIESNQNTFAGILVTELLNDAELTKLTTHTENHKILLFSPFEGDIERGCASSIFVGAKIRPYFNIGALKRSRIELKPAILKVSKTYE